MDHADIKVTPPGPKSQNLNKRASEVFSKQWLFYPIWTEESKDSRIKDVDGNWYLDFMASDYNLGPCHPEVSRRIQEQAQKLVLTLGASAMWESFLEFAEKVRQLSPGHLKNGRVFSASGGSEIVELATMLARYVRRKPLIITYLGGFHGTLPVTVQMTSRTSKFRKGLFPSTENTVQIPFPYCYRCPLGQTYPECGIECANYLEYVLETMAPPSEVAALVCEAIQVPSGYIIPPEGYWGRVQEICHKHDILIIVDESITCMGRTGKMFAVELFDLIPDVLCMAKSTAWGMPLSAMVARRDIADSWEWGTPPLTSMAGHPLSAAAALAGLEVVERENLLQKASERGEQFVRGLRDLEKKHGLMGELRSVGLCTGFELVKDEKKTPAVKEAKQICQEAFKRGLIMGVYGIWNNVLRFFPPLIVTEKQIDEALAILDDAMKAAL